MMLYFLWDLVSVVLAVISSIAVRERGREREMEMK